MEFTRPYLFFCFLCLSCTLNAQTSKSGTEQSKTLKPGLWISGNTGTFLAADDLAADRLLSPFGLSLQYELPIAERFAIVTGLGVQHRQQEIITADGTPCVFPLGIKVITFTDAESYTADQSEVYLKAGLSYQVNRFQFGLAVLPAFRVSNTIDYRFYRDFTLPNRPDASIDVSINSGDGVDLSSIGRGPRSIQYDQRFNLQAALSADYLITKKLRLGLVLQPMLTRYDLSITNGSFCTETLCVDFSGEPTEVGTLRGIAALVQISYGL